MSLNGNPVRIGNGPAAVSEYENRIMPLSLFFVVGWEGTMSRMIRKSEDQPKKIMGLLHGLKLTNMAARINLGNPVSIYCNRSGYFFAWFHTIDRIIINLQKDSSNQENVK